MSRKKRRARDPGSLLAQGAAGATAAAASAAEADPRPLLPENSPSERLDVQPGVDSAARADTQHDLTARAVLQSKDLEASEPEADAVSGGRAAGDQAGDASSIGARLRSAREGLGWSREELSSRARLPISTIANIEANQLDALGAVIYARGFLRSYARSVGVPELLVETALQSLKSEEPPLVAVNPPSLGSRLVARYTNPVVYGLLTLVVVVPLVFLAAPKGARQSPQAFSPMDATQPATVARDHSASPSAPITPDASPLPQPANVPERRTVEPVMASIAPMPATAPAAKTRPVGARVLTLAVSEPTWVELTAADGRRLEYAQLAPGTTRDYVVDGGADLVVGNVPAVVATLNGEAVDLNAVANRNVARLRVGDDAATARQ